MKKLVYKVWDKGNKYFSIISYRKDWEKPIFSFNSNGATKGVDSCYDVNLTVGYLSIGYTNFNYK